MKIKILLVEDDKNMGLLLQENFIIEGYHVDLSVDGESALKLFRKCKYDLLILDIMLPKKDGLTLAKQIRKEDLEIPIIFLTARSMSSDKITGFQIGCDDYITKPFDEEELLYRVKAILRRVNINSEINKTKLIAIGNLSINLQERLIIGPNGEIKLSAKEVALVSILSQNRNSVVPRVQILKELWGRDDYFTSKSLDVYLTKIRRYFRLDSAIELENIHGYGYKLKY